MPVTSEARSKEIIFFKIILVMPCFIRFFFLIFLLAGIYGCEYNLDKKNFRDIEKPPSSHPFDLSLLSGQDTIKVFTETEITYSFNTYGLEIKAGVFSIQGKTWTEYSESGSFFLSPDDFMPGYDTLTLELYTRTGSGSLADLVDAENYLAVKKWLVVFDNRPSPVITPVKSTTKEGFLKISWPKCNQYNLNYYRLQGTLNYNTVVLKNFSAADSNFYVDSCYVGGPVTYRVDVMVFSDYSYNMGNNLEFDDPSPVLGFENSGIDSVRIFWNKSKYPARYKLSVSNTTPEVVLLDSDKDTACIAVTTAFGSSTSYDLSTSPVTQNFNNWYIRRNSKYFSLGTHFLPNWPKYAYNRLEKVVYTSSYDNIQCYDPLTVNLLNSKNIPNLLYGGLFSCPTNSAKVAALSNEYIYIYENKNLLNPVKISLNGGYVNDYFYLTNNDLIAVVRSGKYEQIRISDQQLIASFTITDYPYYSKWACFSTSNDGEYASIVTKNGGHIYRIANGTVTETYSDTRVYRSVMFNEANKEELYLTFYDNNILEVRNPADFSLTNSITLPGNKIVLCNIDPETGYMLLTDYEFLYVMDLTTQNLKLKLRSTDYRPRLYNNRLFSESGYSYDITNLLQK